MLAVLSLDNTKTIRQHSHDGLVEAGIIRFRGVTVDDFSRFEHTIVAGLNSQLKPVNPIGSRDEKWIERMMNIFEF